MKRERTLLRNGSRLQLGLATAAALALGVAVTQVVTSSPSYATEFCNTGSIIGPTTVPGGPGGPSGGTGPANPYPSAIAVSGLTGTITDVNIELLDFTAEFPEDVDAMLAAPDGTTNAIVMSDVGGDATSSDPVSAIDLILDDQASNPLPADSALSAGTFQPVDDTDDTGDGGDVWPAPAPTPSGSWTLATFNGGDPNGTWNLWLTDDLVGGDFAFSGWCIDILTTTSPPTTAATTTSTTGPPGDCGATAITFKTATWTVDEQQQVRVTAKNLGTTRTRCRVTVVARRVSPKNGPTAPDYPGQYAVTLNPGTSALAYFYVTAPVPGTYRVTGCARAISNAGVVNDTNPTNDCRTARRTAS